MNEEHDDWEDTGDEEEFFRKPKNREKMRASTNRKFQFLDEDEEMEIVGKKVERSEIIKTKNRLNVDEDDEVHDDEKNEEALVPSNSAESLKNHAIRKIMKFKSNERNKHIGFACNICDKEISVLEDCLNLVVCTCVSCKDSYYHASCLGRYMLNMPKVEVEYMTSYNLYERLCPVCEQDQPMSLLTDFARKVDGEK